MTPSRPGLKSGSLVAGRHGTAFCSRGGRPLSPRGDARVARVQPDARAVRPARTRRPCAGPTSRPAWTSSDLGPDPSWPFGRWFADVGRGGDRSSPTRWSSPPPTPTARPRRGPCSSRGTTAAGCRFFTNLGSAKAAELAGEPAGRRWSSRGTTVARQVRVTGAVVEVDRDEVGGVLRVAGRGTRSWAPGPAPSRRWWPRGLRWTQRWPTRRPASRRRRAGAAGLGRLPGGAGRPGSSGPAAAGRLHDRLRYRRTGEPVTLDASSGSPPERLRRTGPDMQRPAGLGVQGTFPPQARGSGDCLGFAGHEPWRAGDPTASVLHVALAGSHLTRPISTQVFGPPPFRVPHTYVPPRPITTNYAGSVRSAIQVASARPRTRPSES